MDLPLTKLDASIGDTTFSPEQMDLLFTEFSASTGDTARFRLETEQSCTGIRWTHGQHDVVPETLEEDATWNNWLNGIATVESPKKSSSILLCARSRSPCGGHDRHALRSLPFSNARFQVILKRLHVHKEFVKHADNPKFAFRSIKSSVQGHSCQVFIFSGDSRFSGYMAMCLTYFPDSGKIYGICLGCNPNDIRNVQAKLQHGHEFLTNPFLYMAMFVELEKGHRFRELDHVTDQLEKTLRDTSPVVSGQAADRTKSMVREYLRIYNLKIGLATWKAQLQNMKTVASGLPAIESSLTTYVASTDEYLQRTQDLYEEGVMRCDRVMQGTTLAFQGQLADLTRDDSRVTIQDGKQMKSIALLTMVFLPSTFIATFMSAPIIDWGESGWLFWVISGVSTIIVLILYFTATNRRRGAMHQDSPPYP